MKSLNQMTNYELLLLGRKYDINFDDPIKIEMLDNELSKRELI
jgi:hypothetical protein